MPGAEQLRQHSELPMYLCPEGVFADHMRQALWLLQPSSLHYEKQTHRVRSRKENISMAVGHCTMIFAEQLWDVGGNGRAMDQIGMAADGC